MEVLLSQAAEGVFVVFCWVKITQAPAERQNRTALTLGWVGKSLWGGFPRGLVLNTHMDNES